MVSYCCAADDDELLSEMGAASGRFWRLRLPDGFICRKMELYDDAGKAVTLADTGDIDLFADLEGIGGDDVPDIHGSGTFKTEFFKVLFFF